MRALVVLHGDLDPAHLRHELGAASLVIAADGGAQAVTAAGGACHAIVGDQDSFTPEELEAARRRNPEVDVRAFPVAKDATDAQLALATAFELGAESVVVVGAFGGRRLDHELATIAILAHPAWRDRDVVLTDPQRSVTLVTARREWVGAVGDLVTLLPVAGDVTGVTTEGLRYTPRGGRLPFGTSLGVSNEMTAPRASVSLRDGMLLVIHERGEVGG